MLVEQFLKSRVFGWYFIIGYIGILLLCIICRIESWPFTDYRVYPHRDNPNNLKVYRLAGVSHDGNYHWLSMKSSGVSPTAFHQKVRFALRENDIQWVKTNLARIAVRFAKSPMSENLGKVALVERVVRSNDKNEWYVENRILFSVPLNNNE